MVTPIRSRIPPATPIAILMMAPLERELLLEVEVEDVDPDVAVEEVDVLVGDEPGNGGYILNAGERLALLELESLRILNCYY
jgi:hypothetical protein